MSDLFFIDENTKPEVKPLTETLNKDIFLNNHPISKGTPFIIEEALDEV